MKALHDDQAVVSTAGEAAYTFLPSINKTQQTVIDGNKCELTSAKNITYHS